MTPSTELEICSFVNIFQHLQVRNLFGSRGLQSYTEYDGSVLILTSLSGHDVEFHW